MGDLRGRRTDCKRMRILFICQYFAPDITAAAFRMSDFARLLADAGDEVRVITSFPHKAQVEAQGATDPDDSSFRSAGIQVMRCHVSPVVGGGAKPYLRHYASFLRGSLRLGWQVWREGWRPDVIYATSPPLFVGISGRLLSMLFRRPLVFEVRDIWPDAAVSAGQLRADGRAYRLGKVLERYLYRKADYITCVARRMSDYLRQQTSTPVEVVYNGISLDPSILASVGIAPIHTATGSLQSVPSHQRLTGKSSAVDSVAEGTSDGTSDRARTLLYAGNLGHVQQLDLLLHAWARLYPTGDLTDWRLELLGAGAQTDNLRALARELGLESTVTFTPAVSRAEATQRMHQADALYLHLMADETMEKTIPSKLFDYLLAGRPILGGIAGEGTEILGETGANVTFPPGDLEAMQVALLQMTRDWPELDEQSHANRDLVLERFTRKHAADVLRGVFQRLVDASSPAQSML